MKRFLIGVGAILGLGISNFGVASETIRVKGIFSNQTPPLCRYDVLTIQHVDDLPRFFVTNETRPGELMTWGNPGLKSLKSGAFMIYFEDGADNGKCAEKTYIVTSGNYSFSLSVLSHVKDTAASETGKDTGTHGC